MYNGLVVAEGESNGSSKKRGKDINYEEKQECLPKVLPQQEQRYYSLKTGKITTEGANFTPD